MRVAGRTRSRRGGRLKKKLRLFPKGWEDHTFRRSPPVLEPRADQFPPIKLTPRRSNREEPSHYLA